MLKRYIIRKYVLARSVSQAIRNEKLFTVDDVFLDEMWLKEREFESSPVKGFTAKQKRANSKRK